MIARSEVPVLDLILSSNLEQKKNKMRKECFNAAFSKVTKHWSEKHIKVDKNKE